MSRTQQVCNVSFLNVSEYSWEWLPFSYVILWHYTDCLDNTYMRAIGKRRTMKGKEERKKKRRENGGGSIYH